MIKAAKPKKNETGHNHSSSLHGWCWSTSQSDCYGKLMLYGWCCHQHNFTSNHKDTQGVQTSAKANSPLFYDMQINKHYHFICLDVHKGDKLKQKAEKLVDK